MKEFLLAILVVGGFVILLLVGSSSSTREVTPPNNAGLAGCRAFENRNGFNTEFILRCPGSKTRVTTRHLVGKQMQETTTETDEE